MNIQALIFDLDGTLLNTLTDIAETMNSVLLLNDFPQHPVEDYKILVGGGMRNLVTLCLPAEARSEQTITSHPRQVAAVQQWFNIAKPCARIKQAVNRGDGVRNVCDTDGKREPLRERLFLEQRQSLYDSKRDGL